MNLIVFSLIITALGNKILASNLGGDDDEVVVGGFSPVQPENKSEYYDAALQFLQQNFQKDCQLNDYEWHSLDGSRKQLVQGMVYNFDVTLKHGDSLEQYTIQVLVAMDKNVRINKCAVRAQQ